MGKIQPRSGQAAHQADEDRVDPQDTLRKTPESDTAHAAREAADTTAEETLHKTPESDTAHGAVAPDETLHKTPESDTAHADRPPSETQAPALRDTEPVSGKTDTMGFSDLFSVAGTAVGSSLSNAAVDRQQLGDYELLQRLGEGGMGVVYLARQLSADRIVALKVIRSDRLTGDDEAIIDRFQTEARAAAKLEHDHIVPVFDVGEAEGQHFFSMRLVNGSSIADLLRDGPMENRRAAKHIRGIASGVGHAHRAGILHRDLKPHNVLIDDASDRAMITDFGLAKFVEGDTELTRHGEVMGTPSYMSPEQSRDSSGVGASADIYALGATLYHMLTGRPPFQAATPLATLKLVLEQDPPAPRFLNPGIDKDLETICLKCLEKHPNGRYATAQEVVEELDRYLEGRPIVARPLSMIPRLVRHCRRRPDLAALWGAALIAVSALLMGFFAARASEKKSSASFETAFSAIHRFFTVVSEETLLDQPGMRPVRRQLLQESQQFYHQLIQQRGDDPRMKVKVALAHYRIGWITDQLESPAAAVPYYEAALKAQIKLVANLPPAAAKDRAELKLQLSDTWNALAVAQQQLSEADKARESYLKAIVLRKTSPAGDVEGQRKLANSLMNLGLLEADLGNTNEAIKRFDAAQKIRAKLAKPDGELEEGPRPEIVGVERDLAKGYYNWFQLAAANNPKPPLQLLDQATRKLQKVGQESPLDQEVQYLLAICLRLRGDFEPTLAEARGRYFEAKQILERLANHNPKVVRYQLQLSQVLILIAEAHYEMNEFTLAVAALDDAIQRLEPLAASPGASDEIRDTLTIAKSAKLASSRAIQ